MGYCPLVVLCLPLADLHPFHLTKQFPKTQSAIQPIGMPSAFFINQMMPGFVVHHLNSLVCITEKPFKKPNFHALVFWRICTIIRQSKYIQNTLVLLKMSKIPRVQIKDDLMLTAKPISRLLMIGLTICRAVSCERGEMKSQWVQIVFDAAMVFCY